jgi:hypothetical protein
MAELVNSINSFTYDNLIGGPDPQAHNKGITLVSGAGSLTRGTVLGKITKGAITATAASGNTGNGTCGTLSLGSNAKVGSYTVKATAATTFSVIDLDGIRLADVTAGTAYTGAINFTVTAGATAFVAGDSFTIAVAAGSGYYKTVDSTNVDGSQVADCILEYDTDATSADVNTTAFYSGMFNIEALTFGETDTYATHLETLRDRGIYLTSEKGV